MSTGKNTLAKSNKDALSQASRTMLMKQPPGITPRDLDIIIKAASRTPHAQIGKLYGIETSSVRNVLTKYRRFYHDCKLNRQLLEVALAEDASLLQLQTAKALLNMTKPEDMDGKTAKTIAMLIQGATQSKKISLRPVDEPPKAPPPSAQQLKQGGQAVFGDDEAE